jgi:hypothetical protein
MTPTQDGTMDINSIVKMHFKERNQTRSSRDKARLEAQVKTENFEEIKLNKDSIKKRLMPVFKNVNVTKKSPRK